MPLAPGTRVGGYEILSLLGAGMIKEATSPQPVADQAPFVVVLNWFEELRRSK